MTKGDGELTFVGFVDEFDQNAGVGRLGVWIGGVFPSILHHKIINLREEIGVERRVELVRTVYVVH